jgi:hypothetical protein
MTKYTVVKRDHLVKFMEAVQAAIEQGWVPQGGVAVLREPGETPFYLQALTKDSP